MKLVRYGKPGKEKPGLIDPNGRIRDLSDHIPDLAGAYLTPKHMRKLARLRPATREDDRDPLGRLHLVTRDGQVTRA